MYKKIIVLVILAICCSFFVPKNVDAALCYLTTSKGGKTVYKGNKKKIVIGARVSGEKILKWSLSNKKLKFVKKKKTYCIVKAKKTGTCYVKGKMYGYDNKIHRVKIKIKIKAKKRASNNYSSSNSSGIDHAYYQNRIIDYVNQHGTLNSYGEKRLVYELENLTAKVRVNRSTNKLMFTTAGKKGSKGYAFVAITMYVSNNPTVGVTYRIYDEYDDTLWRFYESFACRTFDTTVLHNYRLVENNTELSDSYIQKNYHHAAANVIRTAFSVWDELLREKFGITYNQLGFYR